MAQTLAQDIKVYEAIPAAQRTAKQSAALATDLATQKKQSSEPTVVPAGSVPTVSTNPNEITYYDPATKMQWIEPNPLGAAQIANAATMALVAQKQAASGISAAETAAIDASGLSPNQPAPAGWVNTSAGIYNASAYAQQLAASPDAGIAVPGGTGQTVPLNSEQGRAIFYGSAAADVAALTASQLNAIATSTGVPVASINPTQPPSPAPVVGPSTPASVVGPVTLAQPTGDSGFSGAGNATPTAATNNTQPNLSGMVGTGGSVDTGGGGSPSGSILSAISTTDWLLIGGLAALAYAVYRKGHA